MGGDLMTVIGLLVLAMAVVLVCAVTATVIRRLRRDYLWRQAQRESEAASRRRGITAAYRRSHAA